jgi:hypothetical protein
MRSHQLRELKAEFEHLMQEMRNTKEPDEKLAILDQARELVTTVNQWIRESNEELRQMRESLDSEGES